MLPARVSAVNGGFGVFQGPADDGDGRSACQPEYEEYDPLDTTAKITMK